MEYYEQTQPLPGYAPIVPGRSPAYYPRQNFDRPDQSDPYATYALPISRPPVASHTRHQRHHGSYGERHYSHERRSRGHGQRQHVRMYEEPPPPPPAGYHDYVPSIDEIFTDASLESDVSEAFSGNSFTFDGSILNIGEKQTDGEGEGEVLGKVAFKQLNATTYASVEVVKNGGRKAGKPSPYLSSGPTVLYSRFVGDAVPQRGCCTADLSVVASDELVRLKKEPFFRWVHLQGRHPNFSSLIDHISVHTDIPTSHSEITNALLHQVRYSCEHSIPTREAKYLDPIMLSSSSSANEYSGKDGQRVHFLCLPYFSISLYNSDKYVNTADAHPTRTLLQTLYPSASVERDLQQAVCHLPKSPQRSCYHVPQMWCLWTDDGFLVTSARESLEEVQQDIVKVNTMKSDDSSRDTPTLHVSDRSNRTWMIPLKQCSTWLDFVAHFSALTKDFESDYCVIHCKAIQHPENWQSLVALAKKRTVLRLILRSRRNNTTRRRSDSPSSSGEEKPTDIQRNPRSHSRSSSPTVAGRDPTESQYTVNPPPNTSDGRNQKTEAAVPSLDNGANGKAKNRVEDPPKDVRVVRVDDFHLFYWLAATSTATTQKDCPPAASGEERDQREGISFTLDDRTLRQYITQMQTYLKKKNKTNRRAYAQCPSKSLDEIEAWAASFNRGKRENVQESEQAIHHCKRVEKEYRRAKRMEERRAEETGQPENERMMRKIEVLEKEEEYRLAKQRLDDLGVRLYTDKEGEEIVKPGIEPQTKEGDSYPYPPERQESQGKARSGSRASSSSAGSSLRSPNYIFIEPATDSLESKAQKTILKLSKQFFTFFFPLAYSSNMTDKYWGGVLRLLLHHQVASGVFKEDYQYDLLKIRSQIQPLARLLRLGPPPGDIRLPIEFSRAWIHLLTFWTLTTTNHLRGTIQGELGECVKLIEVGRSKVLRSRIPGPLEFHEAVLPAGIVSLLVNKTIGKVMDASLDIGATYHAYLSKLEQKVQQKPYNRGHNEHITSVRQEINCVLAVLQDQEVCIRKLRTTLLRGKLDAPSGFPQRREAYILQDCLVSISDRIQNFRTMDERARGILAFNLHRIESNRDRQEGAILIFTIVTIIFLPLNFVSSFFGMNTSDIREMSRPQWAFWASAIPLTLIVLGVSFFVARKIEPLKDLWHSLSDRWRTKSAAGDFYPAPAVQTPQLYAGPQRVTTGLQYRQTGYAYDGRARRGHTARDDYGEYA